MVADDTGATALLVAVLRQCRLDLRRRNTPECHRRSAREFLGWLGLSDDQLNGVDIMYQDLETQAKQVDARHAAATVAVEMDATLSPVGKADKLREAEERRRTAVTAIQAEAQDRLETKVATMQRAIRKAEADDVERLRSSVGDALLVSHYRRQIADMTPEGIAGWIDGAVNDWQRDVLRILALEELDERVTRGGDGAMMAHVALRQIQVDMASPVLRSLRSDLRDVQAEAQGYIESLDLAQYRRHAEDTLGVRAQYVVAPY